MGRHALSVLSVLLSVSLAEKVWAMDTLDAVKKRGALIAGVKVSSPPFGYIGKDGQIVGYDVDIAKMIASKLGVKLQLVPVTPENRIPDLLEGNIDIIASTMAKTPYRAKFVDYCHTDFSTGQKFLTKAGTIRGLKDLDGKKIGTAQGSISELNARDALPGATVLLYDNFPQAAMALLKGEIDAVTTDEAVLLDLLFRLPKGEFEIPQIAISHDQYGLGIRKGDRKFFEFVHGIMIDMERSGERRKLYEKWFGNKMTDIEAAYGVIVRATGTANRFLVMAFKGVFDVGSEVSIFNPGGRFIGKGTVKSIFADEVYVDVRGSDVKAVTTGFIVGMDANSEEAKAFIQKHRDILASIKQEVKREEDARLSDIKRETEEDRKKREAHRDQVHMKRMELEYERDRYYYNYGYRYWYRR